MHLTFKKSLIIICCGWFINTTHAQRFNTLNDDKTFTDSIVNLIKTTKSDSLKCINSFKLSDLFRRNKNYEEFYTYLKIGNQSIGSNTYLKDISGYFNSLPFLVQNNVEGYKKGILKTLSKIKKYQFKENYEFQVTILENLSIIYRIEDNEKESMRLLTEEAMIAAHKSKNIEMLGEVEKHIGIALMNNSEREKASVYFVQAINHFTHAKKTSPILKETLLEMIIITAENYFYLNKLEQGKRLLDKAYLILKKHPKSNLNSLYYYSEGLYHFQKKAYHKALNSYKKGIENAQLNDDKSSENRLKFVQYQAYNALANFQKANEILINLVEHGGLLMGDKKNYYKEIAFTFEKLKDYKKAFQYSQKYITINDSLVESETKKEILKLESKLNKAENERKIYRLNAENEKAKLKLENTRLYYFIIAHVALVLLLLSISLWLYLRSQKRLAAQKELNYQQSISTFKTEKEIAVMQAMIDGEEHERKRIARELHDGIGSKLSALKILLSKQFQVDKPLTPEIKDQERIDILLGTSILEVRQISYNLVPESLLRFGLTKAVSDFCHLVSNDVVQVHFHANEISDSLSSSIQINVYRIVQELVNNALKHAKCTEITVSCSQNKNLLLITVDDNGIGFELSKLSSISGQGIKNLQNRVDLFHGNIQFESDKNGTSCHIELEIS